MCVCTPYSSLHSGEEAAQATRRDGGDAPLETSVVPVPVAIRRRDVGREHVLEVPPRMFLRELQRTQSVDVVRFENQVRAAVLQQQLRRLDVVMQGRVPTVKSRPSASSASATRPSLSVVRPGPSL